MKSSFQFRSLILVALSSSPILACFGGSTGGGCCSPGYAGGCGPTVPSCYSRQPEYRAFPAGYETAAVSAPIIAGPFPAQNGGYAVGGGPGPISVAPVQPVFAEVQAPVASAPFEPAPVYQGASEAPQVIFLYI